MNAKIVALCVLFLTFGVIAKAEIPGGIVYSDGKDAIYYDFKTRLKTSLTSDLSETVVKHPFAVSENGKFLIWLQNSRFHVRELPTGTANPVQVERVIYDKRNASTGEKNIKEDIVWQGNDIKNMSLSPDGSRFAFDTVFQEPGWVFTGKTVYGESGTLTGVYPFYTKIIDSFNGIFYLSTIHNIEYPPVYSPVELNFSHPRYGNVSERPPAPFYTASLRDLPLPPNASLNNYAVRVGYGGDWGEFEKGELIYRKKTIKKSAYYLAFQNLENWEKGNQLGAFIYQIGNQWGPIELRTLDSKRQGGDGDEIYQSEISRIASLGKISEKFQKPREWEILISLGSCEGLFWKPDGSLTFLSNGGLYSIDASKIQEGISKSSVIKSSVREGIGKIPGFKTSERTKGKLVRFAPVNNVFVAEPKLVANSINGACISWVSNDAFLFLGRDMMVYLWRQGKKESVLYPPISSEFYYCSKSPLTTSPEKLVKTALNK